MNFLRCIIWGPLGYVVRKMPYGTALLLGKLIGSMSYILLGKRRKLLKNEFAKMFPAKRRKEINRVVKRTFLLRSMTEVERSLHNKFNSANISRIIDVEGIEYLDRSLSKGKGSILATFHFGAYLQVMHALGYRGYKVNQIASELNPEKNEGKDNKISRYLADRLFRAKLHHSGSRLPANIIGVGLNKQVRPLFKCLNNNEILVIAVDGRDAGKLAAVPFFYHTSYWVATGPVNLALRTGAALHPIFIVRKQNNKNRLIIEKEMLLEKKSSQDETFIYNTAKLLKLLEKYVAEYPSHYGMEILFAKKRSFKV